jgi:hypothetical protein
MYYLGAPRIDFDGDDIADFGLGFAVIADIGSILAKIWPLHSCHKPES